MSASSSLIIRAASPIEWAPVEQAVTTEWLGPIRPYLIETWPEVRLISRPWTKCGLTRPGPFLRQHQRFAFDARQAADARADRNAGALLQVVVHVGEAGVLERLAGGVDRIDDERVDLALDLVVDALVGIEAVGVILRLHFAGDLGFLVGGVEAGDRTDPALAGNEVLPGGLDVAAQRRHQPRPVTTTRRIISTPSCLPKQTASRLVREAVRAALSALAGGRSADPISPCSGRYIRSRREPS